MVSDKWFPINGFTLFFDSFDSFDGFTLVFESCVRFPPKFALDQVSLSRVFVGNSHSNNRDLDVFP